MHAFGDRLVLVNPTRSTNLKSLHAKLQQPVWNYDTQKGHESCGHPTYC